MVELVVLVRDGDLGWLYVFENYVWWLLREVVLFLRYNRILF